MGVAGNLAVGRGLVRTRSLHARRRDSGSASSLCGSSSQSRIVSPKMSKLLKRAFGLNERVTIALNRLDASSWTH